MIRFSSGEGKSYGRDKWALLTFPLWALSLISLSPNAQEWLLYSTHFQTFSVTELGRWTLVLGDQMIQLISCCLSMWVSSKDALHSRRNTSQDVWKHKNNRSLIPHLIPIGWMEALAQMFSWVTLGKAWDHPYRDLSCTIEATSRLELRGNIKLAQAYMSPLYSRSFWLERRGILYALSFYSFSTSSILIGLIWLMLAILTLSPRFNPDGMLPGPWSKYWGTIRWETGLHLHYMQAFLLLLLQVLSRALISPHSKLLSQVPLKFYTGWAV